MRVHRGQHRTSRTARRPQASERKPGNGRRSRGLGPQGPTGLARVVGEQRHQPLAVKREAMRHRRSQHRWPSQYLYPRPRGQLAVGCLRQEARAKPLQHQTRAPSPEASAAPGRPLKPPTAVPKSVRRLPAGFFSESDLRLPGYDDICDDPNAYMLSAANTNLRDDPWQKSGQVLVRLVADVLSAIEKKLNSRNSSTAQKTRAWFQAQHKTLIALGVSVALEARELWQPGLAGGVPIELTVQAIGRVMSEMIQEYPADSRTIREWHSAYDRVVYVVGASVTTVLMLAGALGESTDDDTDRDGDDGSSEDEEETETASAEDAEEVDQAEDSEDENGEDEDGAEEVTDDDIED